MKKFFALVLALVLTMGLCSVSLPASADDTPVELIVWLLGPGEQVDQPEVFELFNEKLHETLPNISVDITIFGSANEHRDSFARAMAAGERIDLCWMGYKHTIADQARDGNIIALDDLLNEYGQGIIETLGEDTIDLHRLSDGKIYNLISWQGLIGNRMGVFIPEESIENSGVGDTWLEEAQAIAYEFQSNHTVEVQQKFFDKFAEYLQGLVDNGKIYKGMNQYTFQQLQISGWFEGEWLAFGDRYTDSFAAYCTMEDDLVKNYFKNQAEYYDKG
jgi:putative aldouronate transport system substrate-binding protein